MIRKKVFLTGIFMIFALVILAGLVWAASSCVIGRVGTNWVSGNAYRFNASVTPGYSSFNITNCSWFYTPSGGSATKLNRNASPYAAAAGKRNLSTLASGATVQLVYVTNNTMQWEDDTVYTLTLVCSNGSVTDANRDANIALATCTKTIYPDNTKPKCSHSYTNKTSNTPGLTLNWTCTNASACSARLSDAYYWYAGTESSDSCSYSNSLDANWPAESAYDIYFNCSDGRNETDCVKLVDYSITSKHGASKAAAVALAVSQGDIKVQDGQATTGEEGIGSDYFTTARITYIVVFAVIGFFAGTIIPGVGNIVGAVIGAVIGAII